MVGINEKIIREYIKNYNKIEHYENQKTLFDEPDEDGSNHPTKLNPNTANEGIAIEVVFIRKLRLLIFSSFLFLLLSALLIIYPFFFNI